VARNAETIFVENAEFVAILDKGQVVEIVNEFSAIDIPVVVN
jgi:hypothetical protein